MESDVENSTDATAGKLSGDSLLASDGLPHRGFVRIDQALRSYPMSKSQAYLLIAAGRLPAYKLGPKITVLDVADVRSLLKRIPVASLRQADESQCLGAAGAGDACDARLSRSTSPQRSKKNVIPDTS